MELAMTFEQKLHDQGKSIPESTMLLAMIDTVMVWQFEIDFIEDKSSLLKNITKMSHFSKGCMDADGTDFHEELLFLVFEDLPSFQRKLETFLEELQLSHLVGNETLKSNTVNYRIIQQDWLRLRQRYRQLETQILEGS